jgi:hypothetical protein
MSGQDRTPVAYLTDEAEAPGVYTITLAEPEVGGNPAVDLSLLEQRLSVERLAPYRNAMGGELGGAIALYEWNTEVAAAFWATLGDVEVLVRNAMHEQLTRWSTLTHREPRWYLDPGHVFTPEAQRVIEDARRYATKHGRRESSGRVVAELAIGFWRYLLASRYDRSLWRTCLWRAFPGQGLRRRVHDGLAQLHLLRNRIAHHEPIHNRPLQELHQTALTVASWVCPETGGWIEGRSTIEFLFAERPNGPPSG